MPEYATFRYPCLDVYPPGQNYVTPSELKDIAKKQLRRQDLKGKLSVGKEARKLKAAFKVSAIWKQPEIRIAFLDGTSKQQNWVKKVIQESLEPLVSKIKFIWNADVGTADIRISFALPGQAWSTVGTDAKKVPAPQPTMNFGWLDDDTQYGSEKFKNTGQVVKHEFGHAMGMVHEHQNPKNNKIVWNKPVVIAELSRTQGWDTQTINHNMFAKYGDAQLCKDAKALVPSDPTREKKIEDYCSGEVINGSEYDVKSIMHYFYPPEWILEGPKKIPVNLEFSELDKKWLRKYYGKPVEKPKPVKPKLKSEKSETKENNVQPREKTKPTTPEPQGTYSFMVMILLLGLVIAIIGYTIYELYIKKN